MRNCVLILRGKTINMGFELELVAPDVLAHILNTPVADVDRLIARGVLQADANGKLPLMASLLEYTKHWGRLDANVRALLAGTTDDALISADELSEKLRLTKDEMWNFVSAGALHCDEARMFRLTNTLMDFIHILDETVLNQIRRGAEGSGTS